MAGSVWDEILTEEDDEAAVAAAPAHATPQRTSVWDEILTESGDSAPAAASAPENQSVADMYAEFEREGEVAPEKTSAAGLYAQFAAEDADREYQGNILLQKTLGPLVGDGKTPIDKEAAAHRIAEETGANVRFLRPRIDRIMARWNESQFDVQRFKRDNPDLADLLIRKPALADVVAKDLTLKTAAGATIWQTIAGVGSGSASTIRGLGAVPQIVGSYTTTPLVNALLGTNYRTGNLLDPVAEFVADDAESVREHRVAPVARAAIAGSSPSGDLLDPSTWSLGENPSVAGYIMQGADVFGGMAPIMVASLLSGGAATIAGGLQSGGAADEQARETVLQMAASGELAEESAVYKEFRAQGMNHEQAVQRTADAAARWAFMLTAPVGALGGKATSGILNPATRVLPNRGVVPQLLGRIGLGGIEEGSQEAIESVATAAGIQQGSGVEQDLTADTFGNFILGALAGGGTGATGSVGLVQERVQERSQRKARAIFEAAMASALAKASPASFEQVIAGETKRSGEEVTALFFDAEQTLRLFQEHNSDPVEVLGAEGAARLEAAALTGEKFEVPVSGLAPLANHPAAAQLAAEHVAARPGYQTAAEIKANRDTDTARRADLVAQYQAEDAPPMTPIEAQIIAGLQAQLAGTRVVGRKDAETSVAELRAFVQTQSERFGVAPDALFPQRVTVERGTGQMPSVAAVAQDADPTKTTITFAGPAATPRGVMERAGNNFKITLTKNANLSTFLHESGHVMLELFLDLAQRPDAPQQVKDDAQAIFAWLGIQERAGLKTEHHEQFARGNEAYLREGNAPSNALKAAFERFKIWLSRVYRDAKALNVELSDDVRGVFDRLLATDEEIAKARQKAGIRPQRVKPDWMDDGDWAAYTASLERAERAEGQGARIRALEDRKREQEAWWKDELKQERAAAEVEYDEHRTTQAWRYIRFGEMGGVKLDPPVRLDRAEVEALIGKEAAKPLHGVMKKKGGERIQDVATMLGWGSGKELLQTVLAHPSKAEWSTALAEQRMREKHGDLLADRQELARIIEAAQHSEEGFGDSILREYVAIGAKSGGNSASVEAIKGAARDLALIQTIGSVSSARVRDAERRAAERFALALARRDWQAAKKAKQEHLLNHHLYREIVKAERARDRFEQLGEDLADNRRRARVGLASPALRDTTDALLIHLGIRGPYEDAPAFSGVAGLAATLSELGVDAVFPQDQLARILHGTTDWRKLTVADLAIVDTALRQVKHAGVVSAELAVQEKRRGYQELALVIEEEAAQQPDLGLAPKDEAWEHEKRRRKLTRQELVAWNTDPEEMFRRLGPTAHAIFERFLEAQNIEMQLAGDVLADLVKLWEDTLPKAMKERRTEAVDSTSLPVSRRTRRAETPTTREWMWMVWLNRGNSGNLQRLLDGYGWTQEQVDAFLSTNMTRQEADFLQGVLDLTEKLRPHTEKIYEKIHGVRPGRVQAQSFTMRFADGTTATYRGGYFPARYDRLSRDPSGMLGMRQAEAGVQDARASAKASIAHGFTESRAVRFAGVVNLDWNVVPSHISQVIHYVAFEEFVRDFNRLLANDTFLETVERRLGAVYPKVLADWGKTVAAARDQSVSGAAEGVLGKLGSLRSNFITGVLGYSVSVFAPDILNLAQPVLTGKVSTRAMSSAFRKATTGGFGEMRREAKAASVELRKRDKDLRGVLHQKFSEIGPRGNRSKPKRLLDWTRENAYYAAEAMDTLTSTIIWWAARADARRSLAEQAKGSRINRLEQGSIEPLNDASAAEAAAVKAADEIVRSHQVVSSLLEQPAILRDRKAIGSLLAMWSYFSRVGNIGLRVWHEAETPADKAKAVARFWAITALANIGGSLLGFGGPEDDEEKAEWAIRKALSGPALVIPLVGGLIEQAIAAGVSAGFHGEVRWRSFNFFTSPFLAGIERMGNAFGRAATADDDVERVGALLEATGLLFGVPGVAQGKRTLGATWNMITGETEPRDPLDAADKLLYGDRPGRSDTILSIGSDAISGER